MHIAYNIGCGLLLVKHVTCVIQSFFKVSVFLFIIVIFQISQYAKSTKIEFNSFQIHTCVYLLHLNFLFCRVV